MEIPEQDIDLVLITGAGASAPFGANGATLPQMQGWVSALCRKLMQSDSNYLTLTGLSESLSGPQFEEVLGDYLHKVQAFDAIEDFVGLTVPFVNLTPPLSRESLTQWHGTVQFKLKMVNNLIHESLYEQFGQARDLRAATSAYSELFEALRVLSETASIVVATTNYDPIAEEVLAMQGRLPDWGQPPMVHPVTDAPLDVKNLVSGRSRFTPVLHLHGRIGWYIRQDDKPYGLATEKHSEQFGTPIVILPDPQKDYGADALINALWREFEVALGRAKRVFILGHSLNDVPLRRALIANVKPMERIGVAVYSEDGNEPHESTAETQRIITEELVGATTVPMRFGSALNGNAIAAFMDRTHRAGFGPE
jgi:hypothetical protein